MKRLGWCRRRPNTEHSAPVERLNTPENDDRRRTLARVGVRGEEGVSGARLAQGQGAGPRGRSQEARLRGRHHHPQGLPARSAAPLPPPRLPAHRLRARRDPPGRLVGHRPRPAGRQGRAPPRLRLRHDLPFSAAHSVVFTHAQTTADALPALVGCLARLGGVPEKLVMDRDSSLVARAPRRRARPVDELAALLGALSMGHIVLRRHRQQKRSPGMDDRSRGRAPGRCAPQLLDRPGPGRGRPRFRAGPPGPRPIASRSRRGCAPRAASTMAVLPLASPRSWADSSPPACSRASLTAARRLPGVFSLRSSGLP